MNDVNDGGPAFPQPFTIDGLITLDGGMSMRDFFAALALHGYLPTWKNESADAIAETAYVLADAMLKAREE